MKLSPKIAVIGKDCVACGCCVLVCPRNAVRIDRGVSAQVDITLCVGCGKCAKTCPAAVIAIAERSHTL
jgi:ferredoxin